MNDLAQLEIWFITGTQHLYGEETLKQVSAHSEEIARFLGEVKSIPVRIVFKPILKTPEEITGCCRDANAAANCIGLVAWMHTFSPAKMWIGGLTILHKPMLHLHTQYNRDLPWKSIDMDFMNLNQAAHGDREFGFIGSRMRLRRKVVVGFWQSADVLDELGAWTRAALGWHDAQHLKVARFGDNMREVAVTEGDKVAAQIQLRYSVNGYGVGDLAEHVRAASKQAVDQLTAEYEELYTLADELQKGGSQRGSLEDAARIELGLRAFLDEGGFRAFTDTFQDLHGLSQLPGIAAQRLMSDGYGFAGEGDWKTAALVRTMKVMATGLKGGTSFMEDYTYHLGSNPKVLGAHMLEICPSIAGDKPRVEIHPLSIGGKADPVRLVFTAPNGPAVNASIVDMGNRFRMIVNEVDVIPPDEPMPKLPVARAVWVPRPNLKVAATSWIYAGGAHHTGFSQALNTEHLRDYAEMAGIEFLTIDEGTRVHEFQKELRWNEAAYQLTRPY